MLLSTERGFKKDPSKLEKVVYFTQIPIATIGLVETTFSVYYISLANILKFRHTVGTCTFFTVCVCVCGGGGVSYHLHVQCSPPI